MMKLTQKQVGK